MVIFIQLLSRGQGRSVWDFIPIHLNYLRIDTGDTAWYVIVVIKRLFLNNYSRHIAMLKRFWI